MCAETPDPLRPTAESAGRAWAARVRAQQAQVERLREVEEPGDFYAPMASRFGQDPHRSDDPSLDVLGSMARPDETWLDIGAGGGRYALPLALRTARVHAVDPSASMLEVLRAGMARHGIDNIDVTAGDWPLPHEVPPADVALMAHIGYDIDGFAAFLSAAERAARRRCVVVMRAGDNTSAGHALWAEIHGEPRAAYPMLQELLVLLVARGALPEVSLVKRASWGYDSPATLLEASRRQLWVRPGSAKDRRLRGLLDERATERDGLWAVDWNVMQDGVVSWSTR